MEKRANRNRKTSKKNSDKLTLFLKKSKALNNRDVDPNKSKIQSENESINTSNDDDNSK